MFQAVVRLAVVLVAMPFVLLAGGCGGFDNEPNLAKAVERTEATGSSRVEIRVVGLEGGQTEQLSCEGAVSYARKRYRFMCDEVDLGRTESIGIDSFVYNRLGSDRRWQKIPTDDDPLLHFSPETFLALLRDASEKTERLGEVDVRGVPTVHYRLTVDRKALVVGARTGETVSVEVWLDDDGLIRRIWVEDDTGVVAVRFEFYDFGVDVDIEAPPADRVDIGEGSTAYGPPQDPAAPCSEREAAPISESRALEALHRHGFRARTDGSDHCLAGVAAVMTNAHREDALEREGVLHCFLRERPEDGAPETVVRRGVDGGDAELLLANLTCAILADSPKAEEKIRPLEQGFEELERAIRP